MLEIGSMGFGERLISIRFKDTEYRMKNHGDTHILNMEPGTEYMVRGTYHEAEYLWDIHRVGKGTMS